MATRTTLNSGYVMFSGDHRVNGTANASGCREKAAMRLPRKNDPNGVNDAGDVAKQGQDEVQPEMHSEPDFEENADGRQENGENEFDGIGHFHG